MTPASRLQAAIDVLSEINAANRPADGTIAAYFRGRRYIGSKDRKAIAHQVWRILRNRAKLIWALNADHATARLLVLGDLVMNENKTVDGTAGHFSGEHYEPEPLSAYERKTAQRLEKIDYTKAPMEVRLELPRWLLMKFEKAFGEATQQELEALSVEAPLDLRANTLKTTRDDVLAKLTAEELAPTAMPYSPSGVRLPARINLGTHKGFQDGIFEVQDEASQLCTMLVDAKPGMAVMDLCAGAGGKTLGIAATMQNKGRIVACDISVGRLERSKLRLRRAGAHNATLRILEDNDKWLRRQEGVFDRVLVDAPCSGTGAWRRNPDARWRLETENLVNLKATQDAVLEQAAPLVKIGGRLIYATCSLLPEENAERVGQFLAQHPEFKVCPVGDVWRAVFGSEPVTKEEFLTLTPLRHGTDGFFVAILERQPDAQANADQGET